jgi:hypothetical protein
MANDDDDTDTTKCNAGRDMFSNRLQGTIPNNIGNLSKLWYIDLGKNDLNGTIPNSFGSMTDLTFLYVCLTLYRSALRCTSDSTYSVVPSLACCICTRATGS